MNSYRFVRCQLSDKLLPKAKGVLGWEELQSLPQHEQFHLRQMTVHDHRVCIGSTVFFPRCFENATETVLGGCAHSSILVPLDLRTSASH